MTTAEETPALLEPPVTEPETAPARPGALAGPRLPLALAALAMLLAFVQRPGKATFDSRIELSVNPSLFLHRAADVWSSTADLGHLATAQFVGYLFPMGPWFAFWGWTGLPMWIGERLWLGAVVGFAAWGMVRLMDAVYSPRRGIAHLAAAAAFAFNPYVVIYVTQGSITLLSYAVLPWLLLVAVRGVREPRRWRYPAVVGLLLAVGGGGVNAAVVFWVVLAPIALLLYEALILRRRWRDIWSFGWRATLCGVAGCVWWAIPVLIQGKYGANFLSFTEQPSSIWATTSMSESLRLLGFWLMYLGVGTRSVLGVAGTYLFSVPVLVATFVLPLVAFAGLRFTRRWPYAPFFGLLAVGALLVMFAGFPEGAPLRRTLNAAYYDVGSLQFLRTTYKATPLLALSLACLAGAAIPELVRRLGLQSWFERRWVPPRAVAVTGVFLIAVAVAALPLFTGKAVDKVSAYGSVPAAWKAAMADASKTTPEDRRVMMLPGELFGSYTWGDTVSSVAPAMLKRPLLIREVVRYSDPRASQLQSTVDDLVQQGRLVPGQLKPLLELMNVGQVLTTTDNLPAQSGSLDPAAMARALSLQPGLTQPEKTFGRSSVFGPTPGRGGRRWRLPELALYSTPGGESPPIVHTQPSGGATVVDGDASGIGELAAHGLLNADRALFYGAETSRSRLQSLTDSGATLVFTDSNRRRVIEGNRLRDNLGPTLGATDAIPRGWPNYDLFPGSGSDAQTVADYTGLSYLRAPAERGFAIMPEHRAFAAFDGNLDTSWLAGSPTAKGQRHIELGFPRARDIDDVSIYPLNDTFGLTDRVGISVNGGLRRQFDLHNGWNTLTLKARDVRSLRIDVEHTASFFQDRGGITEMSIPGVQVRERLRLPTDLASRASGLDLSHSPFAVLLSRTTADFPYRAGIAVGATQAQNPADLTDSEPGLERLVTLPAARTFSVSGWASVSPTAPDEQLDSLAGLTPGWRFASSSRFEGLPRNRASSALDGTSRPWVADFVRDTHQAWLSFTAPHEFNLSRLQLSPGPTGYGFPAIVRVAADGGFQQFARVAGDGTINLGRTVTTKSLTLRVVAVRVPGGPQAAGRLLRAVAIREITIPGLAKPRVTREGTFQTRCGELTVQSGSPRALARVSGTIAQLDASAPLRITSCGGQQTLDLPAGRSLVSAPPGAVMRPDHLELLSQAPSPLTAPASPGSVTRIGDTASGSRKQVSLNLTAPGWLVLGESYSPGWHATCEDASGKSQSLGEPVPIDGFANGWRVTPACRTADIVFAPQRAADLGYWLSGGACLILLAVALVGFIRPRLRRRSVPFTVWTVPASRRGAEDPIIRPGIVRLGLVSLGVALVTGYVFAIRAGLVLGVITALLLRSGLTSKRLVGIATVALVALPVIYVLQPAPPVVGFSFNYAQDRLGAHWVAVLAVFCVAAMCLLEAVRLRRLSQPPE